MADDEGQQEVVRDPIIAELLSLVPKPDLLPRNNSTWREVDSSVFDVNDMYGERR